MTMHMPAPPSCFTLLALPRPWLAADLDLLRRNLKNPPESPLFLLKDENRACRAWPSRADRIAHQGTACDGCARLPKEVR